MHPCGGVTTLEVGLLLHSFEAGKTYVASAFILLQVNLVDNIFTHPDEFLHARGSAYILEYSIPFQVIEGQHRCGTNPVVTCKFFLSGVQAFEINDLDVTLDVDWQGMKMLVEEFLDCGLIEYCLLHAMTKWTFVHFEKEKNTLFPLFARDFELLGEITEGLFEKVLVRIARV